MTTMIKDKFTKNSVIFYSCWWKVEWSLVVNRTTLKMAPYCSSGIIQDSRSRRSWWKIKQLSSCIEDVQEVALSLAAAMKIAMCILTSQGVDNILRLQETWIALEKLYGAILCLVVCCKLKKLWNFISLSSPGMPVSSDWIIFGWTYPLTQDNNMAEYLSENIFISSNSTHHII